MTRALEVRNLSFSYGRDEPVVLKNISFSVESGETLGIIGLSGCGKSTLCHCLCGIIPHNREGFMEGDVLVFGKNTRDMKLALEPKFIIFDEPTTGLDYLRKKKFIEVLDRIRLKGVGYMIISHDEEFCKNCTDRTVHVKEGKVI